MHAKPQWKRLVEAAHKVHSCGRLEATQNLTKFGKVVGNDVCRRVGDVGGGDDIVGDVSVRNEGEVVAWVPFGLVGAVQGRV